MKKILLTILAGICALIASAQDVDTVQIQVTNISVDSLATRLNGLQNDYNYLYCEYLLARTKSECNDLLHSINLSTNDISINIARRHYHIEFYVMFNAYHDALTKNFESQKGLNEAIKVAVMTKIAISEFSEQQLKVIECAVNSLNETIKTIELSLNQHQDVIKDYKKYL